MLFEADEANLQEILATLDLATVFVRDLDGTIRFWSAGCAKLYGWSAAEAVGQSAHELLKTVFPLPVEQIQAALVAEQEWRGDLRHLRRDGTVITVAAHKVLRENAPGRVGSVMESVTDVTELRKMEAQLQELNASLEDRIGEEIVRREAAQHRLAQNEKMMALSQLAGGLAHDFNNVLQAVSGLASLIERRAGDVETVERLTSLVAEAVRRGTAVTRRLLSFTSRGELKAVPVSVASMLGRMRETLEQTLDSALAIRVNLAPGLAPALVDIGQLEVALLNLATNARDAMPSGGLLTFSARVERIGSPGVPDDLRLGDYVRIDISDTGSGMDGRILARAMEPFFTTKPRREGTGLGLPMVKGFVEQSGGSLTLSSQPGQGTTATLWLPTAPAEAPTTSERDRLGAGGPNAPLVLVVDDEEIVREVIAAELRDRGFRVLEADGGPQAISIIETDQRVSLLVSDLAMPGMTGRLLIQEAHRRRPGLPAILLTGYAGDDPSASDEVSIGSYSVLHKPITGAQLASRVADLLKPAVDA